MGIPYGYCHCGCGGKTKLCPANSASQGYVKGEPRRYIVGHSRRKPTPLPEVKLCECGCGEQVSLAVQGNTKWGYEKGRPVRFIRGHANRKRTQYAEEDRGYSTPCWVWRLWTTHDGYGKVSDGTGTQRMAHRVFWERVNGAIPNGLQLDHLCCVPSCVNPDHLEPVTPAENSRRSSTAKLTWPEVREIRRLIAAREATISELAEAHGVSYPTIYAITSGRNWRE